MLDEKKVFEVWCDKCQISFFIAYKAFEEKAETGEDGKVHKMIPCPYCDEKILVTLPGPGEKEPTYMNVDVQ